MDEEPVEKQLAELFEARLKDFFAKSIPEKLEETAKHFDKIEIGLRINGQFLPSKEIQFPALKAISVKMAKFIENAYDKDAHPSIREYYLSLQDRELKNYLVHKWQEAFYLLTPLFLTAYYLFDKSNSNLLADDLREEMLGEYGLDTAKKRKEVCLDYLKQLLLDENVNHGGSKGFWDEIKRLQFLAHYNRFHFVIKNALDDLKKLKKLKQNHGKIWEQIKDKYKIPEEYIEDFFIPQTAADRALEWAKRELQTNDSNEHLRNRVLRQARKEFIKATRNENPASVISVAIKNNKIEHRFVINPKDKSQTQRLIFTPVTPEIRFI